MQHLKIIQFFAFLQVFFVITLNADNCINSAANTYGTTTEISIGDFAHLETPSIYLPTDTVTLGPHIINDNNSCVTNSGTFDCNASGTNFSFSSFFQTQIISIPSINQTFSTSPTAIEDYITSQSVISSQDYNSLKVRLFAQVSLTTTQNPFLITSLRIDDINSSLFISNNNLFSTEIDTGFLGTSTFLTLDNVTYLKTRTLTQGDNSSVTLPNVEQVDAGSWNIASGSCSKVHGSHGDYRFKDGIFGNSISGSSIIVEGADSLYSEKIAANNIYINADAISIHNGLSLDNNGQMSIDTNGATEANVTIDGTTEFKVGSQVCLAAGNYYFENLKLGSGVHLDPLGDGTVRIFVKGTYSDESTGLGSFINQGGDPSQMLIYTKNSITMNAKSDISALLISDGAVTIGSTNSVIHGAVLANSKIDLKAYNSIQYDGYVNTIDANTTNLSCNSSYTPGTYSINGRCDFALNVSHSCPQPPQTITTGPPSTYVTGLFDAWESDKSISDRNITTKIAAKDFNLTLAALNAADTATEIKTDIDVKYFLEDMNTTRLISSINTFDANSSAEINAQFQNILTAHKDVNVIFQTCANYDGSTYILRPHANCSTDCTSNTEVATKIPCYRYFENKNNFAIRPNTFAWSNIPTNVRAGADINVTLQALDYANNPTADYNETLQIQSVSPSAEYKEIKSSCFDGNLTLVTPAIFVNGEANVTFSYSEVGDLNITLTDTNGSEFANVDAQDTTDSQRLITPATQIFSVLAHHFSIDAILQNHTNNFTYISNDLNMSATLEMNITAQSESNTTTQNYNTNCYAQDFNMSLSYMINGVSDARQILYKESNTLEYNTTALSLRNLNKSYFTTDHNGTAALKLQLNFDRNISNALNPFQLLITSMNVSDANNTLGEVTQTLDTNATFLYARSHGTRQRFNAASGNALLYYEAYCNATDSFGVSCDKTLLPNGNASLSSDDPRWFKNTLHSPSTDGNISQVTQKNGLGFVTASALTQTNPDQTTLNYNQTNFPYNTTMNINGSSWLLYNKYNQNAQFNEFEVEFLQDGNWTGAHETNTTTGTNAVTTTNRRTMW